MLLTVNDITQPITEWALDYGIPVALIRSRIKQGWSEECAVTEPMPANPGDELPADAMRDASTARLLPFKGRSLTPMQWAAITGIPYHTIKQRLSGGWTVSRTLSEPVQASRPRKRAA